MHYHQRVHSPSISRIRTRYKDCPKAQGKHIRRSGLLESSAVWEVFHALNTHLKRTRTHLNRTHLKRTRTHLNRTHLKRTRTHLKRTRTHLNRTHLKRTRTHLNRTHLKRTRTDSRVNSAWILSSPPLCWAWMNKFRQNCIKMHVLANILINNRLVLVIQKVLIYSLFNLICTVKTM